MKANTLLSITSLLSVILLTLHVADDVVLGKDVLDIVRLSIYLPIVAVWLCGALLLAERRAGCIISILGALLGLFVVTIHASGTAGIQGSFFHVWLLVAIGGACLFTLILAIAGLIELRNSPNSRTGRSRIKTSQQK